MNNEIVIYQSDNLSERIEVKIDKENETFWLTQEQIGQLFERNRTVISKHLKNLFSNQELDKAMVSAFFAHTTAHGAIKGKSQVKMVKYYNLDAILSVGYRVNSRRGTQFRQWATQRLKDYLIKGYSINNRINRVEYHLDDLTKKVNQMDLQINTKLIPTQGVYMDGQVFDAYELTSRITRSAKQHIELIDNYIDEQTFTQLSKKQPDVRHPPLSSLCAFAKALAQAKGRKCFFTSPCTNVQLFNKTFSPFEGGLRSDDSDEYQTPSEGMTISN